VSFGTIQLSICEELLCALCIALHCSVIHMRGTLMCTLYCSALFSYPFVRNSYVSFGTIQLSICEELLCAFFKALLCIDNPTHILYTISDYECLAWHLHDDL